MVSATLRRSAYDVVVVGGGMIGLASAWRAAQRGVSVLVLDRDAPGAGASGVAAGMLAPVTEAEFGEQPLLRLNLDAARAWPAFAAELAESSGEPSGYSASGALAVAADRDDAEELRRLHGFQRSLGLEVEWLTGRECRQLEPGLSPRVPRGILAPGDGHVDPRRALAALAIALECAGGEVASGVAVDSLIVEEGRVLGVDTAAGKVAAGETVIAAGCWSAEIAGVPEDARPPVRPVKGQILELRLRAGRPRLAERLVRTPRCYVVDRGDGRIAIGATVEEQGFDTAVTVDGVYRLLEAAWEVLPDVGELELAAAAAGLRPGTPDNAPLIGRGGLEGLIWATGHYRNGILLAPVTADAVADLATGGEPRESLVPFSPERFAAAVPGGAG